MRDELRYRATALEEVVRDQGRKVQWLAGRVGVSGSFVSRVMRGQRTVGAGTARSMAEALDVPVSLVFEGPHTGRFCKNRAEAVPSLHCCAKLSERASGTEVGGKR